MMTASTMGKKLDLSRLTDEEAKHVWEVIQRDMDLRKKEEDRLGELKTKIEKEDTKRELLGTQSSLTDSHCIRCLQPFKFLVNSKRQCLDCQLFTCKACSRYNKKERGWVCDPCRMARVLKIGTLEWYHEHVRSRFKRFGSAKVMRSLYKRLNGEHGGEQSLRGSRDDDTHSMPDVRSMFDGHEEDSVDMTDGQHYRLMRKTKRLLSVHPLDFDLDNEYSTHSRRQSFQHSGSLEGVTRRESMIAEADIASVFQQILEEKCGQGKDPEFSTEVHLRIDRRKSLEKSTRSDDGPFPEHRIMRTRSLSKITSAGNTHGPHRQQLNADIDTSEEEEEGQRYPMFQLPPRRRSRASSQENLSQPPPQIIELTKRMSAIESLLSRLEQKMTVPPEQLEPISAVDLEEEKLRKKLGELADNISDKGLSSEEEEVKKAPTPKEAQVKSGVRRELTRLSPSPKEGVLSSSSDDLLPGAQKGYVTAGKPYIAEKKLRSLEESVRSRYSGTTDSELSELEDKVALAAAKVHNTESEVSDIENRIAALSAAGMALDKSKKKISSTPQRKKLSHDFPTKTNNGSGFLRKPRIM